MADLRKDYPKEIPIIDEAIKYAKRSAPALKDLKCQVDALVKYHKTCAKAMNKLIEELNECPLKD